MAASKMSTNEMKEWLKQRGISCHNKKKKDIQDLVDHALQTGVEVIVGYFWYMEYFGIAAEELLN